MFQNRAAAKKQAQQKVSGRTYKTEAARKSATTQITNRQEREIDDWTRKNVELD